MIINSKEYFDKLIYTDITDVFNDFKLIVKEVNSEIIEELYIETIYNKLVSENIEYKIRYKFRYTEGWYTIFTMNKSENYYELFVWCD